MSRRNKDILSVNTISNKICFSLAVLLHIVLAVLLFSKFDKTINVEPMAMAPAPAKPIIDAVAINETEIASEVSRLENIEKQKRQKEKEHQQALQKQKDEAVRLRKQEEARIAKLKEEQTKLKLAEEKQKKERIEKEKIAEKEAKEKLEKEKVALEKIKQEKEALLKEKQKIEEAKKQAEAEALAKQKKAEAEALAKAKAQKAEEERLANLRNSQAVLDKTMRHAALIGNKVMQNWRQPVGVEIHGFKCKLSVRLSSTGDVLEARVVESSGNFEFDRSSELAVRKASPLPLPEDRDILESFMKFTFTFNPETA